MGEAGKSNAFERNDAESLVLRERDKPFFNA
jgi:hypothetical protein